MIHQLKTKHEYFEAIAQGRKPFEVRYNDRNYHVGDFLALNELSKDEQLNETGRCMMVEVTYILGGDNFCKEGWVIMGIRPCWIKTLSDRDFYSDRSYYTVPIYNDPTNASMNRDAKRSK